MRFVPHGEGDILEFVEAGIAAGNRPELVGGGPMRSLGGWSEVVSQRRHGDRDVTDERILGSGEFVQRLLKEAETHQKDHFFASQRQQNMRELIATTCKTKKTTCGNDNPAVAAATFPRPGFVSPINWLISMVFPWRLLPGNYA